MFYIFAGLFVVFSSFLEQFLVWLVCLVGWVVGCRMV